MYDSNVIISMDNYTFYSCYTNTSFATLPLTMTSMTTPFVMYAVENISVVNSSARSVIVDGINQETCEQAFCTYFFQDNITVLD